jgi:MAF protein
VTVGPPLLLASGSPRRRELLSRLEIGFTVRPPAVDEEAGGLGPEIAARKIARIKAEAVRLMEPQPAVLAADTIVVLDGAVLGKPSSAGEARAMLLRLRGRVHTVITALALMPPGRRTALSRHATTTVTMRSYSEQEIEGSIARGDPFDKAGGYAIQDALFAPVRSYRGCYCNVVGLPLWSVIDMLRRAEVPVVARVEDLLPQCAACPLRPPP